MKLNDFDVFMKFFLERMMNLETEIQNQLVFNNNDVTDDLQVKDRDRLIARSQQIAEQYDDYDVNIGNYKEGKQTMRLFNKTSRELNQRRIDMVKDHKQKEKNFKIDVDAIIEPLQNVSNKLKEEISDVDDALADKRREKVAQTVHEMCEARGMEDIDVQPKWTEKSMCKRNGEPNSKGLQLINDQIKMEKGTQERIQMGSDEIQSKAKELDLEPDGYLMNFKSNPDHDNLKFVIEAMMSAAKKRELEREKREERTQVVHKNYVNTETGEIEAQQAEKSVRLKGRSDDLEKLYKYAQRLGIEWRDE